MRQLLRAALLDNAPLKLASFGLALVLFAVVRGDREAITSVHAKVVYLYPAERVLMTDPVTELRITVRGPLNRLGRLEARDLEAVKVDLHEAREGELRFTEEMVRLPPGLRVESISPPGLQLHFEPRAERAVPVQAVLAGEPASGFRVSRSACSPREVTVVGARSVVEAIARAPTRPLRIADTRESVRGVVDLAPAPPHAEWRLDGPVSVAVEVAATVSERAVRGLPIVVTGAERLEVQIEPATADVLLRGPTEVLPAIAPALRVEAQPEDARPAWTPLRRPVLVSRLPAGVSAEVRPDAVILLVRRRRE